MTDWGYTFRYEKDKFFTKTGLFPQRLYAGRNEKLIFHKWLIEQLPRDWRIAGDKTAIIPAHADYDTLFEGVKICWLERDNWFQFYAE